MSKRSRETTLPIEISHKYIGKTFEPPPYGCTELSIKQYTVFITRLVGTRVNGERNPRREGGGIISAGMICSSQINQNSSAARFRCACIVFIDFIRKQKIWCHKYEFDCTWCENWCHKCKSKISYDNKRYNVRCVFNMLPYWSVYMQLYTHLFMHAKDNMIDLVFNVRCFEKTKKIENDKILFASEKCWGGGGGVSKYREIR